MADTDKTQPEKPDATPQAVAEPTSTEPTGTEPAEQPTKSASLLREIASGDVLAGVLAVLLAVFVGSVMIAATDEVVRDTATYITARPSDFFTATWDAISGAYSA